MCTDFKNWRETDRDRIKKKNIYTRLVMHELPKILY